jgi:hypothetical protein
MSAFKQSLGRQPFIYSKDGILVDGQLGGQSPDGRKPVSRFERFTGALRPDLGGDLPGDWHPGRCFYANLHVIASKCLHIYNSRHRNVKHPYQEMGNLLVHRLGSGKNRQTWPIGSSRLKTRMCFHGCGRAQVPISRATGQVVLSVLKLGLLTSVHFSHSIRQSHQSPEFLGKWFSVFRSVHPLKGGVKRTEFSADNCPPVSLSVH